jgi:protein SCO1/2
MKRRRIEPAFLTLLLTLASPAYAQRFATGGPYKGPAGKSPTAEMVQDVKIEQHLSRALPLDTTFRDERGRDVRLGDYFGDKPVVLALVYYRCPMLCTQVLNGILRTIQAVPLKLGRDYQIVTISFDPAEGPGLAAEKKEHYVRASRIDSAEAGWHFLTGDAEAIRAVTEAVGFQYRFDSASRQFAHPSGFVVATPQGTIAKYFYGIDYAPRDLQLALVESSAGTVGTPVDQVLLLCYHYDPLTGKYGLAIAFFLKLAGTVTVGALGVFLVTMIRRERRRPKLVHPPAKLPPVHGGIAGGGERHTENRQA